MSVLISGIGIAGPTLAYWLSVHGIQSTLVERAPQLRTGGYALDFWGLGFDVAEKMGILPDLRRDGYNIREMRIVNAHGRQIGGFDVDIFRKATRGRYVTIARTDLARNIYRQVEGNCETIFGDSITGIDQQSDGVEVTFEHAAPGRFDVVIGADGLHSVVRKLCFGSEDQQFLGYSVAAFEVSGYPRRDTDVYLGYSVPGKQVGRLTLRDDRTLFLFVFADERGRLTDFQDVGAKKEALRLQFGGLGWECPQILEAMDSCTDLYFDPVSQIRMKSWSKGRVGLVGDAASCPSLLAGQGSALAMVAAYVVRGRAWRARRQLSQGALQRHEKRLHAFVLGKQEAAKKFASSFTPKTWWGDFLRNQVTKTFGIPFLAKWLMGSTLLDHLELRLLGTEQKRIPKP